VTELPDTTYSVKYTAGSTTGTDSISVYDPECEGQQYAWTAIEIVFTGVTRHVPSQYATIQAALDVCNAGDSVLVAPGTYSEHLTMTSGVILASEEGPTSTIIDGGGGGRGITCSYVNGITEIHGFTVRNGKSSSGGGIRIEGGSPRIDGNLIQNNVSTRDGGGVYCLNCSATITDNTFSANSSNLASNYDGGALFIYGNCDAAVHNNVFRNNSAQEGGAILISMAGCAPTVSGNVFWNNTASIGGAVEIVQSARPTIESNTFYGNTAPQGAAILLGSSVTPTISHNIIAGHTSEAIRCVGSGTVTSSCNDMWNTGPNYSGCSFDTSSNLVLDPLLCDAAYGDFHLQLGSPCDAHPVCGRIGAYGTGCLPPHHADHPVILSTSPTEIQFGGQSTIIFCLVDNVGAKVVDGGVKATVASKFGLGTLGTVTELPDTTYSVKYTAGSTTGTDSISVYDPECEGQQYAWTAITIVPGPTLAPRIVSVKDVPGDQGGKVIVYWTRSSLDVAPDTTITHYSVWRSIGAPTDAELGGARLVSLADVGPDFTGPAYMVTTSGGRIYYWDWVANVPAHYFEGYSSPVPTLMDSTGVYPGWHYFLISAQTSRANVFYDSEPDSGYSVDNLPPEPPQGVAGRCSFPPAQLLITWKHSEATDASRYAVYKADKKDFIPSEVNRISTPVDTFYVDRAFDPDIDNYYKVSALDTHGNESQYSLLGPEEITGTSGSPHVPRTTYLEQNFPNPFNPATTIQFAIAKPGRVSLGVYDVTGRPVRTLVEGWKEPRFYSASWDGRDEKGNPVASGVYLYKLEGPGYSETKKMVLLK
jgi:hypothetical protein